MQYLLMIYGNEPAMLSAGEDAAKEMMAAYRAYTEAMAKAGILQGGNRLRPSSDATTVRVNGSRTSPRPG